MRFAFTEDHVMFRDSVREALRRVCPPETVRAAWDEDGVDLWPALAETGLFSVLAPQPEGLGLGMVDLALPLEEVGRAAVPAPVTQTAAVAVPLLAAAKHGDLAAVVSGAKRVAVCDRGRAVDADRADLFLAVGPAHVHILEGPETIPLETVDGGLRLFSVEGVAAPFADDTDAFDRALVGTSAQLLGLARHMLDVTVEYARVRTQFGRAIGSFQAVKHHLADALLRLEFATPVVHRAAWSIDQSHPDRSVHASMAKVYASEAAVLVAEKALQCHGAIGYSFEYDLHMWMKRAWALAEAWRDPAWHRERVARHLRLTPGAS